MSDQSPEHKVAAGSAEFGWQNGYEATLLEVARGHGLRQHRSAAARLGRGLYARATRRGASDLRSMRRDERREVLLADLVGLLAQEERLTRRRPVIREPAHLAPAGPRELDSDRLQ
jgi:hypothetical protein